MRRQCCAFALLVSAGCSQSSVRSVLFPPGTDHAVFAIVVVDQASSLNARAITVSATTAIELPDLSSGAQLSLMLFDLAPVGVPEGPLSVQPNGRTLGEIEASARIFAATLERGQLSPWTGAAALADPIATPKLLPPVPGSCPMITMSSTMGLTKTASPSEWLAPFGPGIALLGLLEGTYQITASSISSYTINSSVAITSAFLGSDGTRWLGLADGAIWSQAKTAQSPTPSALPRLPGPVTAIATSTAGLTFAVAGSTVAEGLYSSSGGAWAHIRAAEPRGPENARLLLINGGMEVLVMDPFAVWRASPGRFAPTMLPGASVQPVSLFLTGGRGIVLVAQIRGRGTHWYSLTLDTNVWSETTQLATIGGSSFCATPFGHGFVDLGVVNASYIDDDVNVGNEGVCPMPLFQRLDVGGRWVATALDPHSLLMVGLGRMLAPPFPVSVVRLTAR
jgi:hypothetical protein